MNTKLNELQINLNSQISKRLNNHLELIKQRESNKGDNSIKHYNENYDFKVVTSQEKYILINYLKEIRRTENGFEGEYFDEAIIDLEAEIKFKQLLK